MRTGIEPTGSTVTTVRHICFTLVVTLAPLPAVLAAETASIVPTTIGGRYVLSAPVATLPAIQGAFDNK